MPAPILVSDETPSLRAAPPTRLPLADHPEWTRALAKKGVRRRLAEAWGERDDEECPLSWASPLGPDARGADSEKLIRKLGAWRRLGKGGGRKLAERLSSWLERLGARPLEEPLALECLAWTRTLPWLVEELEGSLVNELLDALYGVAVDAAGVPFEQLPLARQLVLGELPLSLARVLVALAPPELRAAGRELAVEGARVVSSGIADLLDGDGLPHARGLGTSRSLTACWTRSLRVARGLEGASFDKETREIFAWHVLQAVRLSRPDGAQSLGEQPMAAWCEPLMRAALELEGDAETRAAAAALPWSERGPRGKRRAAPPDPSAHSEWGQIAVLRGGWEQDSPRCTVTYLDRQVRCELSAAGQTWLTGEWPVEVEIQGKRLAPTGDFVATCWHADKEIAYLELEAPLGDGWRLQRQFLLAGFDHLLWTAAVVLGEHAESVQLTSRPPLADQVEVQLAEESREGQLRRGKLLLHVLPLSFPEWRAERHAGELNAPLGACEHRQTATGQRQDLPLLFDLDPVRGRKVATWRRLTVGESLQIVPRDVAVGYRVQSDTDQWLFYRSLAPVSLRSLLGQHLIHEFAALRLRADGMADDILQIEVE